MNFLKNFFDDDGQIIGLCGFDMMKPKYSQNPIKTDFFFNPFETKSNFETNFSKNTMLSL